MKQTTYETCLAAALMRLCQIKPDQKKELEIWKHGWNFNFLIGQLEYVSKKYKVNLKTIIEDKLYYRDLRKVGAKRVILENKNIDLKLIDKLINSGPVIVYVDNYYFGKVVHAPHFFTITNKDGHNYRIFDSWDGEIKLVSKAILSKSISSLRNRLLFSPVLITLDDA